LGRPVRSGIEGAERPSSGCPGPATIEGSFLARRGNDSLGQKPSFEMNSRIEAACRKRKWIAEPPNGWISDVLSETAGPGSPGTT
jgi:hypothetical protein